MKKIIYLMALIGLMLVSEVAFSKPKVLKTKKNDIDSLINDKDIIKVLKTHTVFSISNYLSYFSLKESSADAPLNDRVVDSISKSENTLQCLRANTVYDSIITPIFSEFYLLNPIIANNYIYIIGDYICGLPIQFASKGNKNVLFISAIVDENVYNLKTLSTASDRKKKILNEPITKIIKYLSTRISSKSIGYLAINYVYGVKDFSKKYSSPSPESICLVVPMDAVCQFGNLEITKEDLFKGSDIYMVEVSSTDLQKTTY